MIDWSGDPTPSEDEWACRWEVIDLHDFCNRREFLTLLSIPKQPGRTAGRGNPKPAKKQAREKPVLPIPQASQAETSPQGERYLH